MLEVTGNDISLTRGDTAELTLKIHNTYDGQEYVPSIDDSTILTIRDDVYSDEPVMQKIVHGLPLFEFVPSDTKHLDYKRYVYDIEVQTKDGEVYTVIPCSTFRILKEVTV